MAEAAGEAPAAPSSPSSPSPSSPSRPGPSPSPPRGPGGGAQGPGRPRGQQRGRGPPLTARVAEEGEPDLTCSVCLGVFEEPVDLAACRHSFCRGCIVAALRAADGVARCPLCRKPAGAAGGAGAAACPEACLVPNRKLERAVAQLPTVCPNPGCGVVVRRAELAKHAAACPAAVVSCPHARFGCAFRGSRAALAEHRAGCRAREVAEAVRPLVAGVEQALAELRGRVEGLEAAAEDLRAENRALRAAQGGLRARVDRRHGVLRRVLRWAQGLQSKDAPGEGWAAEYVVISAVIRDEGPGLLRALADIAAVQMESWVSVKVKADTAFARIAEVIAARLGVAPGALTLTVDAPLAAGGELVPGDATPFELGLEDGSTLHISTQGLGSPELLRPPPDAAAAAGAAADDRRPGGGGGVPPPPEQQQQQPAGARLSRSFPDRVLSGALASARRRLRSSVIRSAVSGVRSD